MLTNKMIPIIMSMLQVLPVLNGQLIDTQACGQNLFTDATPKEMVAYNGEHPWIALVGYENLKDKKKMYSCTGSLINDRYVLTTASCLKASLPPGLGKRKLSHVRLGEYDITKEFDCLETKAEQCRQETSAIDVGIEETIAHPQFNLGSFQLNDIGLIRLERSITFSDFNGLLYPICLSPAGVPHGVRIQATTADVVGWDFGSGHPNDVLMKETLIFAETNVCKRLFNGFDEDRQICMKSENLRTRCTGDSGSPLVTSDSNGSRMLIGILSYGPLPCGFSEVPSVFTSVSHYREWIDNNIHS